jgi:endonuclease VIII
VPEGDTIHRLADRLAAALDAGPLARFEAPALPAPHPMPGERIGPIQARGKHLLIGFSGGLTLRSHLAMEGSWRLDRQADRPPLAAGTRRPGAGRPQVRVATGGASAVCADTREVELLDAAGLRRHPMLAALGPDLCDDELDLTLAVARLDRLDPATPIGEVLLDQRPACGIGNVYRSEVLWASRVSPVAPLGTVPALTRADLYATAHRLLRANLGPGPRRTVPSGLAVYERAGRRCLRCRDTIRAERIGERARTVWWCPGCQTEPR